MATALVFVCLLSYVSGGTIDISDAEGSTLGEYNLNDNIVPINEMILEHTFDLLREMNLGSKPEAKFAGIGEGKIFCSASVNTKYRMCREMCRMQGFMSYLVCKSIVFKRYIGACLGGNLECYGDSEFTTSSPITQMPDGVSTSPPNTGNCGISPDGTLRVFGGTIVTNNDRYPWLVGLSLTAGNSRDYICSGSVITRSHILTSASCFRNGEIYTIGFGSADEANARFERTQNRVHLHENYNRNTFDNNIAIIEFSPPIDFQRNAISPICLVGNANDNFRVSAIISGWGSLNANNPSTAVSQLREATIQVDECPDESRYTDNMICTTVGTTARDACKGDGGGPLIISSNGRQQQIGIVSSGNGCPSAAPPVSVYTKVGRYVDWINQKVSPESTFR